MKRILALLLILVMTLFMFACENKVGIMKISEAKLTDDESQMLELVKDTNLDSKIFDYNLDIKGKEGTLGFYELKDNGKWKKARESFTWSCEGNNGRICISYEDVITGEMQITVSNNLGTVGSQYPTIEDSTSTGSSASAIEKSVSIKYGTPIALMIIVASDDEKFNGANIVAYGNTKQLLKQKSNDRLFVVLATFSDKLSD